MRERKILLVLLMMGIGSLLPGQQKSIVPDLSTCSDPLQWTLHNRELNYDRAVHLDAKPGDGVLWNNGLEFENGRIELEIRGKDLPGRSFVGVAFHGVNDSTFEAIYFRPFNFKSPERKGHSVQYISHPSFPWHRLRQEFPEKYENPVSPVPDPNEWFHATVVVNHPEVKVFVNHAKVPSLVIHQIGNQKNGWIGFWVGNNAEGSFRKLTVTPE